MLEKLLNDIVAKHVLHELDGVHLQLLEHLVLLVAIRRLQLLLNETRAVLVAAEFDNVTVDLG